MSNYNLNIQGNKTRQRSTIQKYSNQINKMVTLFHLDKFLGEVVVGLEDLGRVLGEEEDLHNLTVLEFATFHILQEKKVKDQNF